MKSPFHKTPATGARSELWCEWDQLALEAQTDLVIMGVRGRSALDLALFGSTTHRVLQSGSCPVLAVHI